MFQLVEKIIPAFERAHGPGYQALIMVDNSQGHSAYSKDALLTSRMNLRPGGKQARLRDGWYMKNGKKIIQPMVFSSSHPEYPNLAKGMKEVLVERGLWRDGMLMECNKKSPLLMRQVVAQHASSTCNLILRNSALWFRK